MQSDLQSQAKRSDRLPPVPKEVVEAGVTGHLVILVGAGASVPAGLPGGVAGFIASVSASEAASLLSSTWTMTPHLDHLDRQPKAAGQVWEADRERFETVVRDAETVRLPAQDLVVVVLISLDGIMVPMKDAPRTPSAEKMVCGPKGHKEASSGTLALFDANGNRLHTIYLARIPESKKVMLQAQFVAEFRTLVAMCPAAELQAIADGAEENWRIIGEIAEPLGRPIELVLDCFYAAEHVDEALRYPTSPVKSPSKRLDTASVPLRGGCRYQLRADELLMRSRDYGHWLIAAYAAEQIRDKK